MTEQLTEEAPQVLVPEAPAPGRTRRVLWAVARWTAAVAVCGGVGAGTAMGITALDRTDVPGLATESDGRWEYPQLRLPALPADRPRPFTEGNDAEIHHTDARKLLLPAPAGAAVDPEMNGGWVSEEAYLAGYGKEYRTQVRQVLDDTALRHIAGRAWTMPDGTRTSVLLLKFSSVAHADELYRTLSDDGVEVLPAGVAELEILDRVAGDVRVPNLSAYAYGETKPFGSEQTRWAYITAGDTLAVVTQTRKGGALAVPFQQTVVLQAQLLG
ncbi:MULTISPECIES: hypothetical protein [Streptomyces]|uniref:Uncharacterized protein n=1 Tax=Streptomyces venezuelae TaxID=54571 RepID=A0A5P2ATG0_STRVZ|nr:hypothetical protein [Streptomyces venezuelae]QES20828.1 hypothetical protein DEJ46_18265 [Streptomyces venezuelae]